MGHLIKICPTVAKSLVWKEEPRYCKNLSLYWSPWGPVLSTKELSSFLLKLLGSLTTKGEKTWQHVGINKNKEWR